MGSGVRIRYFTNGCALNPTNIVTMNAESIATPTLEIKGVKLTESDIARFWSKVNKNGPISEYCPELGPCWLWTAGRFQSGYGQFCFSTGSTKRNVRAHRVSLLLSGGVFEGDRQYALHRCHTNFCVNPSHIRPGTPQENMSDKVAAGRQWSGERLSKAIKARTMRGENHKRAIFTNRQVAEIKRVFEEGGVTKAKLAADYKASHSVISHIIKGRSWTHV